MNLLTACKRVVQFSQLDLDLFIGPRRMTTPPATSDGDTDLRELVNWGIRSVAMRIRQFDPLVTLNLTANVQRYRLDDLTVVSKRIIRPWKVYARTKGYFNGYGGKRGLYNAVQFYSEVSNWRDQAAGTTSRIVYLGRATNEILLYPAPSAAYIGSFPLLSNQFYIEGEVVPNDLATDGSDDTEELPIPFMLHEAACFCAAVKGREPMATEQSAWTSLQVYSNEWESIANQIASEQANDVLGPADEYSYYPGEMWI